MPVLDYIYKLSMSEKYKITDMVKTQRVESRNDEELTEPLIDMINTALQEAFNEGFKQGQRSEDTE